MRIISQIIIVSGLFVSAPAFACPDGQSSTSFGICLPNVGGDVGKIGQKTAEELRAQTIGPILAAWIAGSRSTSIAGSSPVPFSIRQALNGYISQDILNRARFRVGDSGILNAAHNTHNFDANVAAVTLDDVIVFRNQWDAYNDAALWAHELTHVRQFREWGVADFAIRYARNPDNIENEARQIGDNYASWRQSNPPKTQQPMQFPAAAFCITQLGVCPMGQMIPQGSSCYCPSFQGPIWGVAN
jgi:Domain of unknown function (DUF4157)